MAGKSWTVKEEQFVKDHYVEKGAQWCARALKRSTPSIHTKASQLRDRSDLGYLRRNVTKKEEKIARSMWQKGATLPMISWKLDISEYRARSIVQSLGLYGDRLPRYTDDENIALLKWRDEGMGFKEIASRLGRPYNSVRNKYYRLIKEASE